MRWRAAIVVMIVAVAGSVCSPGLRRPSQAPVATPGGVRFTLVHAEATSVAVAGTFNEWSVSSHPLSREGTSHFWTRIVPLPPGEHLFMFVINGTQWITPPLADDFVDDGFGAKNGVVLVHPTER